MVLMKKLGPTRPRRDYRKMVRDMIVVDLMPDGRGAR